MTRKARVDYSPAAYKVFQQSVKTACAEDELPEAVGPLYCPPDQTLYLPTNFEIEGRPWTQFGDFAVAIATAHEVGHHVQEQLGILERERSGELYTFQTELQADCFAGMWGQSVYNRQLLEAGDFEEAINIAASSGDSPERPLEAKGAHGSPEDRVQWLRTGYDYGEPDRCLAMTEQ